MAEVEHGTLVASAVAAHTLDPGHQRVEVLNRTGTAEIFVKFGADPTVEGADCWCVPAAIGGITIPVPSGATSIRLISTGTPKYSISGVD